MVGGGDAPLRSPMSQLFLGALSWAVASPSMLERAIFLRCQVSDARGCDIQDEASWPDAS